MKHHSEGYRQPEITVDPRPEGPSDLEYAMFLLKHLQEPCGVEVAPGKRATLREFYVREGRRALESMRDPEARALLEQELRRTF